MTSQRYFEFLVRWVDGYSHMPDESYVELLRFLQSKTFISIVPNDMNRAEDGIELRKIFTDKYGGVVDQSSLPCTVLEMMIALAKRMAYMLSDESTDENQLSDCFWIFIRNLGLEGFTDAELIDNPPACDAVDRIIDRLVERTYFYDGSGGMFPIRNPKKDQRITELWYQMQAYLIENYD